MHTKIIPAKIKEQVIADSTRYAGEDNKTVSVTCKSDSAKVKELKA